MQPIRLELNGMMLTVCVEIASLCGALGLPQHDLFHQDIYNEYQHPELTPGTDMNDVDHID